MQNSQSRINRWKLIIASALVCMTALNSGCMLTPNRGERLSDRNETLHVMMATLTAEDVTIQARNIATGAWQDIGTVETYYDSVRFAGLNWIVGSNNVRVPNECWELLLVGHTVDRFRYGAEIRAVTESGIVANTYRRGFFKWMIDGIEVDREGNWHIDYDKSEAEARFNGNTLKIYTDVVSL